MACCMKTTHITLKTVNITSKPIYIARARTVRLTKKKRYIKLLLHITNDLEKLRESSISEKSLLAQCKKTKRDISGLSLCRRLPNVLNDSCTQCSPRTTHI